MSFVSWLKNQANRNDSIGMLALNKNIISSRCRTLNGFNKYLEKIGAVNLKDVLAVAWGEYEKSITQRLLKIDQVCSEADKRIKDKTERMKKGIKPVKMSKKEQQIQEIASSTILPDNYFTIWTEEDLSKFSQWAVAQEYLAVDTETLGLNWLTDEIVGVSFYGKGRGYYIPLLHDRDIGNAPPPIGGVIGENYVKCLSKDVVRSVLKPLLENSNRRLLFHNNKFDYHILRHWMGIKVDAYFDVVIASALLDENIPKNLKELAGHYLGIEADKFQKLFGKVTFNKVPICLSPITRTGNLATYYAVKDAEMTFKLYEFFNKALESPTLVRIKSLFYDLEMPFSKIVAETERRGVRVDKNYLINTVSPQLHKELKELKEKIYRHTDKINLNSPIQLSEVLYNKLKLPHVNEKSPKSTDKQTLKKLKKKHEVIPLLLDYRSKVKLITSFADKLPNLVVDGRVHTNFNTSGAVTGRMSSNNPNLQQIPKGNLIRNAFIADEGRLLVSCDFSAQELRVLAHCSQDKTLLNIYKNDEDVHSMTATGMYNQKNLGEQVSYDNFQYCRKMTEYFQDADGNLVTERFNNISLIDELLAEGKINTSNPEILHLDAKRGIEFGKIRNMAKVVNFGIIYGMGAPTLSDTLEIPLEDAEKYIENYFNSYPGVQIWIAAQQQKMNQVKYTETLLGRKRRVYPEIDEGRSAKYKKYLVEKAYKMGVNAIIQGSSADMLKLASVKLQPLLKELDAHIVLFIHDELVFDVPKNIGMKNLERIAGVMCDALPVDCGMKSSIEIGVKWNSKMSEDEINTLYNGDE